MKKLFTVFFILATLSSINLHAQGWLWGRGNLGGGNDAWGVASDPSGNVFVSGITLGGGPNTFNGHTIPQVGLVGYQTTVVKYDPYGNYVWGFGTQNGGAWLMNVAADQFGNSYLFATITSSKVDIGPYTFTNNATGNDKYILVKFDPAGNVKWARADGEGPNFGIYASFAYILSSGGVCADDSGNVYITTSFQSSSISIGSNVLTNKGGQDIFVAKYDSLGNVKWATAIGDSANDNAFGVTATHNGKVYISGISTSSKLKFGDTVIVNPNKPSQYSFVGELDMSGTPIWAMGYGGPRGTFAAGVASDINNGVYVTGGFQDTTISFEGSVVNNPNPGKSSLYLTRLDSSNKVDWHKVIYAATSGGTAWGFCIAMSPCGAIWVSGNMSHDANIDGNVLNPPTSGGDPVFIAGYTIAGAVAGYAALASGSDDQNGIACDYSGNVYMCADYYTPSSGSFQVGSTTLPPATGGENLYVGKYASVNTGGLDTVSKIIDTIICTNDSNITVPLRAPTGFKIYTWSDTSVKGSTMMVNKPGKYWVRGVGNCSIPTTVDTFTIHLGNDLTFSLGPDTEACKKIIIKAPDIHIEGVSYLWQNGNTTAYDTVKNSSQQILTISKGVCSYTDTMNVNIYYLTAHLRDTFLCKELPVNVPMGVNPFPGANVKWNTGSTDANIVATDTGIYWVHITEGPCKAYDTMHLTHEFCDCWSTAPSAFTPNGDGRNDLFKPVIQTDCPLQNYVLTVFDRYGQRIFSTTYPKVGWDGSYNNVKEDVGVYFWEMEYYGGVNHVKHQLKGDVTLIR